MPRFLGLAVQTDVRCASGAIVAFFAAADLLQCQAVLAPIAPESLVATFPRTDDRTDEIVAGRVLRTCFSEPTYDREWDIAALEDASTEDALTVTAQPIALRMGRVLYVAADAATGAPVLDVNQIGISAADAIDDYVLPALAAHGMSWVSRGTVDSTDTFDLAGEWATALEIVRAIAEPGRANGEWQLRRNGDAGYLLDIVDAIGSSAATLRLRSEVNLLQNRRSRSLLEAATRLFPRGSEIAAVRTMADHLWRVASVVSGTILELEDILGGDGPLAFDDQANGLYLAVLNSHTFASQLVSDSVASAQRVTVPSTAGITAGELCRFFVGSGANGARVTSLTNPAQAAARASGGLGDLAEFLDRPEVRGDCNLVPNPWMRDWASGSAPPDDWTETAGTPANRTLTRETTLVRESPYTLRAQTSGTTTLAYETPDIRPWAISGRRHFAALWFHVVAVPAATDSAVICELITAGGTLITEIGRWIRGADPVLDTWFRFEKGDLDLSGITSAVRIRVRVATATGSSAASGWNILFSHALLAESEISVEDIEYSGGTRLWQEANRALAERAGAVRAQTLRVADLEADDPSVFSSLAVIPGQTAEVTDLVLLEQTSPRVLEYRPNYLDPLASQLTVGTPPASAVRALTPGGLTLPDEDGATPDSELVTIESSFDEDGQLIVRVIGDSDTRSLYCTVSASAFPTEATLMGTVPTNGRQAEFTFAGPYDLGATVYIVARGSSGFGGQGGLSDAIQTKAVRANSATSKTIRIPAVALMRPYFSTGTYSSSAGYYVVLEQLAQGNRAPLPVPKGVTLTAVRARSWAKDAGGAVGDTVVMGVNRIGNDGAVTALGSGDTISVNDAWETMEVGSLSEDTSGDRSYELIWSHSPGIGATDPESRCAWIEYDIDVPNVDANT